MVEHGPGYVRGSAKSTVPSGAICSTYSVPLPKHHCQRVCMLPLPAIPASNTDTIKASIAHGAAVSSNCMYAGIRNIKLVHTEHSNTHAHDHEKAIPG